jgi:hypothetical protein
LPIPTFELVCIDIKTFEELFELIYKSSPILLLIYVYDPIKPVIFYVVRLPFIKTLPFTSKAYPAVGLVLLIATYPDEFITIIVVGFKDRFGRDTGYPANILKRLSLCSNIYDLKLLSLLCIVVALL